jgi:hypothetical protein
MRPTLDNTVLRMFLPTRDFEESQAWIEERGIFDGDPGVRDYEHSIMSIAAE